MYLCPPHGMSINGICPLFDSPGKHRQLFNDTRPHSMAHRRRAAIGQLVCCVDDRQISVMTQTIDNLMTSLTGGDESQSFARRCSVRTQTFQLLKQFCAIFKSFVIFARSLKPSTISPEEYFIIWRVCRYKFC